MINDGEQKMKRINIKSVDLNNSYFHFTDILNLDSIEQRGLEARVGENTNLVGGTGKRIYVSKGIKGILSIIDTFLIKFEETRICDIPLSQRKYFSDIDDFSGEGTPTKEQIYAAFRNEMRDRVYLLVDIASEDFLEEDNKHWGGTSYDIYCKENHNIGQEKLSIVSTDKGSTALDVIIEAYDIAYKIFKENGKEELFIRNFKHLNEWIKSAKQLDSNLEI